MVRSRPGPADDGFAQRHDVFFVRQIFLDAPVEKLVLEEKHRIIVANRRFQQALGVVGRRGIDHLQSRRVHEVHFRIGGMERPAVHAAARGPANHHRHRRAPR